jgi:8-oxo-dGTP diphosphatase
MAITVVAAIIEDDAGLILCAKRGDWKDSPNKWEFPGGKPKPGENLEAALKREIKEELGIEIKDLNLFDRSSTQVAEQEIDLACFSARLANSKPVSSTDHSELLWLKQTELSGLNWASPDVPAVKKLTMPYC